MAHLRTFSQHGVVKLSARRQHIPDCRVHVLTIVALDDEGQEIEHQFISREVLEITESIIPKLKHRSPADAARNSGDGIPEDVHQQTMHGESQ